MIQTDFQRPVVVSNEAQLRLALLEGASPIELRNEVVVTQSLHMAGTLTLDGRRYTIRRGPGFTGALLVVEQGDTLTLQCVTLDGHRARSAPGESMILVEGGTLNLSCGTVLQNNHTLGPGGAVLLRTGPGLSSVCRLLADSAIVNCRSEAAGGGISAIFSGGGRGLLRIAGSSTIENNRAMTGGGVAAWHGPGGRGLVLIEGSCHIENNLATHSGGGVACENTASQPVILRIGGNARMTGNRAFGAGGGGVFLHGATAQDRIIVGEKAVITSNMGKFGGGLCLHGPGEMPLINGGTVANNRAEQAGPDLYVLSAAQSVVVQQ